MNGSPAMKPDGNVSAKTVVVQWKSVAIGCDTAIHTDTANAPDLTSLNKSPWTALRAFRNKGGKITLPQPQSAVLGYPGRQHEKKIGYRSPNWISVPFNLSLTKNREPAQGQLPKFSRILLFGSTTFSCGIFGKCGNAVVR